MALAFTLIAEISTTTGIMEIDFNYLGLQELTNDSKNAVRMVAEAILEVKQEYLTAQFSEEVIARMKSLNCNKNTMKRQMDLVERAFAYEFYHQVSKRLSDDLKINGEVGKVLKGDINSGRFHSFQFPDLVLHHSHQDMINQQIVFEIKRKENKELSFEDFKALENYINDLQFKVGVFIIINIELSDFVSFCRKADNVKKIPNVYNIVCFVLEKENKCKYFQLKKIKDRDFNNFKSLAKNNQKTC